MPKKSLPYGIKDKIWVRKIQLYQLPKCNKIFWCKRPEKYRKLISYSGKSFEREMVMKGRRVIHQFHVLQLSSPCEKLEDLWIPFSLPYSFVCNAAGLNLQDTVSSKNYTTVNATSMSNSCIERWLLLYIPFKDKVTFILKLIFL